jgi:hypothetical protein
MSLSRPAEEKVGWVDQKCLKSGFKGFDVEPRGYISYLIGFATEMQKMGEITFAKSCIPSRPRRPVILHCYTRFAPAREFNTVWVFSGWANI